MKKGVALLYHKLSKSNERYKYVITEDSFNNHLRLLKERGFKSVQINSKIDNPKFNIPIDSFMITFDDGDESN